MTTPVLLVRKESNIRPLVRPRQVKVTKPQNKTPYELLTGRPPIRCYLRPFGTPVSAVGTLKALNDDEPSYPDDPSMPYFEDIYASLSVGIFTDSSYDDEGYIQKQQRNNHKDFQHCLFACFSSQIEPKKISQALEDESWVDVMQEELLQFQIQKVWILVDLPFGKKVIRTK
nr:putative ribonuclease H-like domain-containing protein [Tanacetum cinerariifolium]